MLELCLKTGEFKGFKKIVMNSERRDSHECMANQTQPILKFISLIPPRPTNHIKPINTHTRNQQKSIKWLKSCGRMVD